MFRETLAQSPPPPPSLCLPYDPKSGTRARSITFKHGCCNVLSTHRPPFFWYKNYNYRKVTMGRVLRTMDCQIWTKVEKWYCPSTITNKGVQFRNSKIIRVEWDEKNNSLNVKATKTLVCALSSDEFNGVCNSNRPKKLGHFRSNTWGHKPS